MDTHGFCHYIHMDKFGRISQEGARTKEVVGPRMIGKRQKEGSGEKEGGEEKRNG